MKAWIERLKSKPWIAHLLRAQQRFTVRLGAQFGAAITYFSVLALVPLLAVAFSVLGFVLVVLRPDLLDRLANAVAGTISAGDADTQQKILELITSTLGSYTLVGVIGLLSAIYSGAGWMGNLKNAVRAQWRPSFDLEEKPGNIVVTTLLNLVTLLGLIVGVALTFGLATVSTTLTDAVLGWFGLADVVWLGVLLRIVPVIVSVGAGWLIFLYLYTVLPETREPWPAVRRGALMGSVGLVVLQYLTSFLVGQFAGNKAVALFGPIIVLMLFFNLFARLILFVAAWIATSDHEAVPALDEGEERVRFALQPSGEPEPTLVPQDVAARSVRVGMGAGYVTGAATGVGLGALVAYAVSSLARRLRRP